MTEAQATADRYVFLDYLRAIAAWLVVWDHLANIFPQGQGLAFAPAEWVRRNVTGPLGIIQDFGWFGVALFFLISGFIISDRARVEGVFKFVIRRVLRIYPMLAVPIALSCLLVVAKDQVTVRNLLLNLTLANYLIVPQVVLVGVAWTLIIEVVFYALTAATQFARGSPHRIAFNLAVVLLTIWQRGAFGPSFGLFATVASYLPILVMGQTIYWWLAKGRLSAFWGLAYLAAAWGIFLLGLRAIQPGFLPVTNSYVISLAYALLLFVAMLRMPLPELRLVRFLSDTSYSIYLLHGIVGWVVFLALVKRTPLPLAILLAAAASLAAAFATYRLVERPTQRLGRYLTRDRKPSEAA
jgi:peptidoglycan/LPS O-acetylase OafA/YrhL